MIPYKGLSCVFHDNGWRRWWFYSRAYLGVSMTATTFCRRSKSFQPVVVEVIFMIFIWRRSDFIWTFAPVLINIHIWLWVWVNLSLLELAFVKSAGWWGACELSNVGIANHSQGGWRQNRAGEWGVVLWGGSWCWGWVCWWWGSVFESKLCCEARLSSWCWFSADRLSGKKLQSHLIFLAKEASSVFYNATSVLGGDPPTW